MQISKKVTRNEIYHSYIFVADGALTSLFEFFNCSRIISKIFFARDEEDRQTGTEMEDFRNPLDKKM